MKGQIMSGVGDFS